MDSAAETLTAPYEKVRFPDLETPSVLRYLSLAAIEWSVIVGSLLVARYLDIIAVYVIAGYVIGVAQHRLAVLRHEVAHRHLPRQRCLNDLITHVTGWWPLVMGTEAVRINHHGAHA